MSNIESYPISLSPLILSILSSSVVNAASQELRPHYFGISVSVQAQPVPDELVRAVLGNRATFSPIVTVEPRRRKFHKPITMTIPVPPRSAEGHPSGQRGESAPCLRLLCSITGKSTCRQLEHGPSAAGAIRTKRKGFSRRQMSSSNGPISHRRDVSCTVGGHHRNHTAVLCN